MLTPSALIGNLVGIHLNVVAPSLLLLALMVILLTYITFRTCSRGRRMWRCVRTILCLVYVWCTLDGSIGES